MTGLMIQELNPGGGKIFHARQDQPWHPHSLLHYWYQVFSRGNAARTWY